MRLEHEKIQLAPLNIDQIRVDRKIDGLHSGRSLAINHEQLDLLQAMGGGRTIQQIVAAEFHRGRFIVFSRFRQMLEFLVEEKLILNPNFQELLEHEEPPAKTLLGSLVEKVFGSKKEETHAETELAELPFFRSLKPELVQVFLRQAKLIETPPKVVVCQAGTKHRSLFVLLEGSASVWRGSKRMAVLSHGSVFGEVGFFFGEARTATVVTDRASKILQIQYAPEIFDSLIKMDSARDLQKRLWVVHALLKSTVFKGIPDDCFDALIFAGDLVPFADKQWICKEGDPGSTCYIIVRGSVVVSKGGNAIRNLEQGDCFGEVALIMTGGRRSASVHSENDVLLLEIHAGRFYQLLADNLVLACQFEKIARERIQDDRDRD